MCRTPFGRLFVVIDRAVNDLRIDRCWGGLLSWWCSLAICPLGGNYFSIHGYLGVRTLQITGNALSESSSSAAAAAAFSLMIS